MYAGVIAALVTVPVILPILLRLVQAEVKAGDADLYGKTAALGISWKPDQELPDDAVFVRIQSLTTQTSLLEHATLQVPPELDARVCDTSRAAISVAIQGRNYGAACWRGNE